MEHVPFFTHTRDYGCRYRRYRWNDIEMLSLENEKIRVVIALGKGADIVDFLYKPLDIDFLWHSFNELSNASHSPTVAAKDGSFLDSYAGGWQELFPVYGADAMYHGGEIGIHGEACLYPWDCAVLRNDPECVEVLLSLRTVRSPFLLEKRIRIVKNDPTLYLTEKVTNLGACRIDFMWGQHPAFGFPFLDESVRLHVEGTPTVTVPAAQIKANCPFAQETVGPWPILPGRNGDAVDVSRVRAPEDRAVVEYGISDLRSGQFELFNERKNLGIRLRFDPEVFRYLWVWGVYCGLMEYPWYGRSYVMAVEPWSSMPAVYDKAKAEGTLLHLDPGRSVETELSAEVYIGSVIE